MTTTTTTTGPRRALGRGLESLLPSRPAETVVNQTLQPVRDVPVSEIDPNPYQTRRHFDEAAIAELAESIRANGVMQPIVVRSVNGRFQLIAGERRWRASQQAGREWIPAMIKQVSNQQALEMTIIENLQREDLNPIEQARAFERLGQDFNLTQEQMSQRTGKERASIANFLRLLKLPQGVQDLIEGNELSLGHAKVLLMLDTPEAQWKAVEQVRAQSLSVRQTEQLVHRLLHPEDVPEREPKDKRSADPNVRAAEEGLQRALGVRVTIRDKQGKGKIVIEYASLEDFDRILESLGERPTA